MMKKKIFTLIATTIIGMTTMAQNTTLATPHISAYQGAFAKTVLMPGDPLRAKFIAENFLEDAELVTSVRNMLGYTGTYKGKRVSVMGSGMGMPSIGIYSYELYNFFGVENILRVGSAGAIGENIHVRDVLLGMIPFFVGDIIDIFHRANTKNMAMVQGFVDGDEAIIKEVNQRAWQSAIVLLLLLLLIVLMIWMLISFGSYLYSMFP